MKCLPSLRHLELNDLLLDNFDARHLLDDVCFTHCHQLRTLKLVNVSRAPCQLMHVAVFVLLRELWLSPVTLGDDVVTLLGYYSTGCFKVCLPWDDLPTFVCLILVMLLVERNEDLVEMHDFSLTMDSVCS
jgi:hypothetical protein